MSDVTSAIVKKSGGENALTFGPTHVVLFVFVFLAGTLALITACCDIHSIPYKLVQLH